MENNFEPTIESERDLLDSFDVERFWYVLKRSKYWMAAFVIVAVSISYLYVRYTKPLYKAESVIKLDFASEATVLGLSDMMSTQDRNEISGEIELIKSKLFLSKVVEAADIDVSYHVYGRYLTDERYHSSPFVVSYKIINPSFFNRPFDIEFVSDEEFILEYTKGEESFSKTYSFAQEIMTSDFNLLVEKTEQFDSGDDNRYFFVVRSPEQQLALLQSNLEVIPENFNAKTIKVSLTDHNKLKASELVNLIDSLYLDYTKEVKNAALEQKIEFLDQQIEQTEQTLSEFENYFEEFTIENRTTDLGQDLNRTLMILNQLDSQEFFLKRNLQDLNIIQKQAEKNNPLLVGPFLLEKFPSVLSEAVISYTELQQERELKLGSYNESSYIIERLDMQLGKSKEVLDELISTYRESLEESLVQVKRRRTILERNLSQLPSMGTEYGKNRRVYNIQEDFMLQLQTSKMELEITRAGTVTKNIILAPASLPQEPVKPQKLLILIAGFMLGLVISVVFLLIRYLAHNKVAGIKELEKLVKVPILGAVPQDRSHPLSQTALVVEKGAKTSISEALRTIRTNMDFIRAETGPRVIGITSTVSGEGKTFVAANLGAIMALTGKTVCVVDIDMRKPKVHMAFDSINSEHGVSTILSGRSTLDQSIQSTEIENLSFVAAGITPPNPSELLMQPAFKELLSSLKKKFDTVILDTPPVGLVTDGRLVIKLTDLQLYIIRADYSKRAYARVLNDLKASGQFDNLSVILNSIDSTPGYGYGYGYGHGYYSDENSSRAKVKSKFRSLF